MRRYELSGEEWEKLHVLLPSGRMSLATRYDKTATSYTAVVTIAALTFWL